MGETIEVRRSTKRVLVVEDHEYSARIYCDFLKVWGYSFERVANGLEAVAAAKEKTFDVIMMDVMMPEMDGYEATKRILADTRANAAPWIVGVTANTLEDDLMRCRAVGMYRVVMKPVDFDQLRDLLDSILLTDGEFDHGESFVQTSFYNPKTCSSNVVDARIANEFVERMSSIPRAESPLDAFSHSVDECMEKLESAVAYGKRSEIENCAHILKSVAALVGARDLEDLSKGLEDAARRGGPHFRPMHWYSLIDGAVKALRMALLP